MCGCSAVVSFFSSWMCVPCHTSISSEGSSSGLAAKTLEFQLCIDSSLDKCCSLYEKKSVLLLVKEQLRNWS